MFGFVDFVSEWEIRINISVKLKGPSNVPNTLSASVKYAKFIDFQTLWVFLFPLSLRSLYLQFLYSLLNIHPHFYIEWSVLKILNAEVH